MTTGSVPAYGEGDSGKFHETETRKQMIVFAKKKYRENVVQTLITVQAELNIQNGDFDAGNVSPGGCNREILPSWNASVWRSCQPQNREDYSCREQGRPRARHGRTASA